MGKREREKKRSKTRMLTEKVKRDFSTKKKVECLLPFFLYLFSFPPPDFLLQSNHQTDVFFPPKVNLSIQRVLGLFYQKFFLGD